MYHIKPLFDRFSRVRGLFIYFGNFCKLLIFSKIHTNTATDTPSPLRYAWFLCHYLI